MMINAELHASSETIEAFAKAVAEQAIVLLEQRQASPWMNAQEAAAYARVPMGTLREWSQQGKVRRRGSKRALYHREELDEDLGFVQS